MKNQIATDISQSRRLLYCGVDPKTADMVLLKDKHGEPQLVNRLYDTFTGEFKKEYCIPAWSLSALLELLPNEIKEDNDPYDEINEYRLLIYPYLQGWQVDYQYCKYDEYHGLTCTYGTTLIEACVQMIEWLTANGYSLNKIVE